VLSTKLFSKQLQQSLRCGSSPLAAQNQQNWRERPFRVHVKASSERRGQSYMRVMRKWYQKRPVRTRTSSPLGEDLAFNVTSTSVLANIDTWRGLTRTVFNLPGRKTNCAQKQDALEWSGLQLEHRFRTRSSSVILEGYSWTALCNLFPFCGSAKGRALASRGD
jgi:hypothetical protein